MAEPALGTCPGWGVYTNAWGKVSNFFLLLKRLKKKSFFHVYVAVEFYPAFVSGYANI